MSILCLFLSLAPAAVQADDGVIIRLGGEVVSSEAAANPPRWVGRPINLDFEGADIHSVFRFMSNVTGLAFVLTDDVKGTVTLHLEQVPADLALYTILLQQGLAMTPVGDRPRVVTVAPILSP